MPTQGQKAITANVDTLYGLYEEKKYQPPAEAQGWVEKEEGYKTFQKYAEESILFYDQRDNLEDVRVVISQREPYNLAMGTRPTETHLKRLTGYSQSGYAALYQKRSSQGSATGVLPPNIGVLCKTPLFLEGKSNGYIWVYNAISYGFDSTEQPDYKYFLPNGELTEEKFQELRCKELDMMTKIFAVALHKKQHLFFPCLGCQYFCHYLDTAKKPESHPNLTMKALFVETFISVLLKFRSQLEDKKLLVHFMTQGGTEDGELATAVQNAKADKLVQFGPFFPECFKNFKPAGGESPRDSCLLINSWDPHSMVGNGNAADKSLDGEVGRRTAVALLCAPQTNPWLQVASVDKEGVVKEEGLLFKQGEKFPYLPLTAPAQLIPPTPISTPSSKGESRGPEIAIVILSCVLLFIWIAKKPHHPRTYKGKKRRSNLRYS